MVRVAGEMQRDNFKTPLLIGGATTSTIHTAVKVATAYDQPVVHVLDASRAVGVVNNLINRDTRASYIANIKSEQEKARERYLGRRSEVALLTLAEARCRRLDLQWSSDEPPAKPDFLGIRALADFPLTALVPFIGWSPFFHAWQLKGTYPRIFEDRVIGLKAIELFADGWGLLEKIVAGRWLRAHAVYGFWPANSEGDDIQLFEDESRKCLAATFHTLRQQTRKAEGENNFALADFVAPKSSGLADYIGGFAVSAGEGL